MITMNADILGVELVLDIQRALRNGRSVENAVAGLRQASLPGIMEYGCLRWSNPGTVPPLPPAIVSSPLGIALQEVKSELGLRQRGGDKVPPRDTRLREYEFHLISQEVDVLNTLFGEYLLRFEFAAKRIGLPAKTVVNLQA